MTRNTTENIPGVAEAANAQKPKQDTEDLRVRSYKAFVNFQMKQRNAPDFVASFRTSTSATAGNTLRSQYIDFLKGSSSFVPLAPVDTDPTKDENLLFINKLNMHAALQSSMQQQVVAYNIKKSSVLGSIKEAFEVTPTQNRTLENKLSELDLDELNNLMKRGTMDIFAGRLNLVMKEDERFIGLIDSLGLNEDNLTDTQKKGIKIISKRAFPISEGDAKQILSLFKNENDKKKLLPLVKPVISLEELIELDIITKHWAREKVVALLRDDHTVSLLEKAERERLSNDPVFLDNIVFSEIYIKTPNFPHEDLTKIIESKAFIKSFEEEVNAVRNMVAENILEDVPKDIGLDAEKKFAPDFLKSLEEKFGKKIGGLSLLESKEHRTGTKSLYLVGESIIDKKSQKICVRIDHWNEYNENENDQRPTIQTSFLSARGGGINKTGNKRTLTYKEFYSLINTFETGDIIEESSFKEKTDNNDIRVLGELDESGNVVNIKSLTELNNELDLKDKDGKSFLIKLNATFSAKMEKGEIQMFTVSKIDNEKLFLSGGFGAEEGPFYFTSFFHRFVELSGKRYPSLNTPEECLNVLKEHGSKKKGFTDLEYDAKKKCFVAKNRKDDPKSTGVKYFYGKAKDEDGKDMENVIEVISAESNKVKIKIHGHVKEETITNKDGTTTKKTIPGDSTKEQWVGYQFFYSLLENSGSKPKDEETPIEPVNSKDSHVHMHNGFIGKWMQGLSLHDILAGGKSLVDFVKHKLEHSSKLHSATASVGLAKLIGMGKWNPEWLMEQESQIQNDNKKLMEEELEKMGKINPPKTRHKYIFAMLQDKGTPSYHLQAATICMLQKHGTLYTGNKLKELEGTWFFYKRLRGLPIDFDVNKDPIFQKIQKSFIDNNRPLREEDVIIDYFKIHAPDIDKNVNPGIWRMIRDGWEKGIEDEKKGGGDEVARSMGLNPKLSHVTSKWKSKEYANGLGALEKIWGQGGTPKEMNQSTFLLAMSNVPSKLNQATLKNTGNYFLGGHIYPALLFIATPEKQQLFRKVVETLCTDSGDKAMSDSCTNMMKGISKNPDGEDTLKDIEAFWRDYGDDLAFKLSISPKSPEIFLKKDLPGYEHYKTYFSTLQGMIGDSAFHTDEKGEGDNGTYTLEKSTYALVNAEKYVKEISFQGGPGALVDKTENIEKFDDFIKSIDAIKNIPISDDKKRLDLYKVYHRAILGRIIDVLGPETYTKLASGLIKPGYANELINRGFEFPSQQDRSLLEGEEYEKNVQRDFDKFMNGGTTHSGIVEEKTQITFEEIMAKKTALEAVEIEAVKKKIREGS